MTAQLQQVQHLEDLAADFRQESFVQECQDCCMYSLDVGCRFRISQSFLGLQLQVSLGHSGNAPGHTSMAEKAGNGWQRQKLLLPTVRCGECLQATPRQQQEGVDLSMIIQWIWSASQKAGGHRLGVLFSGLSMV